jgi:hypothetical protein
MLVTYTHISELTTEQKQRLKAYLTHAVLEGLAHIQFEGKVLSISEVKSFQKEERQKSGRQVLLG